MYIYRLRKSEIKEMHSKLTRAEGRLLVRDFARTSFECPPSEVGHVPLDVRNG